MIIPIRAISCDVDVRGSAIVRCAGGAALARSTGHVLLALASGSHRIPVQHVFVALVLSVSCFQGVLAVVVVVPPKIC